MTTALRIVRTGDDVRDAELDLALMQKFIEAHRRRGTEPDPDSLQRYEQLRLRVPDAIRRTP